LGHAFGTTPHFWLNLQLGYDLALATTTVSPDAIRKADSFAQSIAA
jgi:plasmid maintenance system antidote protein VapI